MTGGLSESDCYLCKKRSKTVKIRQNQKNSEKNGKKRRDYLQKRKDEVI